MLLAKLLFFSAVLTAQAERQQPGPTRIEFRSGHSSLTINDLLAEGEEKKYLIAGRNGQRLSMQLTAHPRGSVAVQVLDSTHESLMLYPAGNNVWQTVLPTDGDYEIDIVRHIEPAVVFRYQLGVKLR